MECILKLVLQVYKLIHSSSLPILFMAEDHVGNFDPLSDICLSRNQARNIMITAEEITQLVRSRI